MITESSDAAWERYGRLDPYFGVYNKEQLKTKNLDASALKTFFRSGEDEARSLLKVAQEHFNSGFRPTRALDFGCGVGRLTIPLAGVCSRVVGADVAPSMLEEAQKNLRNKGVSNVDLVVADDRLSRVTGTFDFLVCCAVFQHIPPGRGETILKAMIARLEEGGIGALRFTHFISSRESRITRTVRWMRKYVPFVNNAVNLALKRPFFYPMMQWNIYDLGKVVSLLQEQGCRQIYTEFSEHGSGSRDVTLLFRKYVPSGPSVMTRR